MDFVTFLIRIFVCFGLSVLIGLERQLRHRMIGLRTNVLVSIGAFMFMSCSFGLNVSDQSRIAAQIVSGIGFLGAGVILRDGSKVKGLNTAATLWCVSAIGVLTSSGMLKEASVGTIFVLLSNIVLRIISKKLINYVNRKKLERCIINVSIENNKKKDLKSYLFNKLKHYKVNIRNIESRVSDEDIYSLKLDFLTYNIENIENLVSDINNLFSIKYFEWEHYKFIDIEDEEDSND